MPKCARRMAVCSRASGCTEVAVTERPLHGPCSCTTNTRLTVVNELTGPKFTELPCMHHERDSSSKVSLCGGWCLRCDKLGRSAADPLEHAAPVAPVVRLQSGCSPELLQNARHLVQLRLYVAYVVPCNPRCACQSGFPFFKIPTLNYGQPRHRAHGRLQLDCIRRKSC